MTGRARGAGQHTQSKFGSASASPWSLILVKCIVSTFCDLPQPNNLEQNITRTPHSALARGIVYHVYTLAMDAIPRNLGPRLLLETELSTRVPGDFFPGCIVPSGDEDQPPVIYFFIEQDARI